MNAGGHFGPGSQTLLEIIHVQTEIAKLGLDLGGVMAYVSERAQHLTRANGAVVELAEGDEMVYRTASGVAAGQLGLRLRRKGSLSGLCVETGKVLRCNNSETDRRVDREACRRVGLRSMVVVPLKHGDTVVGVLKVMSPRIDGFSDADAATLELMSELIAASMYHAAKYGESELYIQATHDSLTGLPNRALFYDRLRQLLGACERNGGQFALLNLDMDGLKRINDTLGHRAGDAAICEAAHRMRKAARKSDTVARIGGDEFAALLPGIGKHADITAQCKRLVEKIQKPFRFEDKPLDLGASIGAAIYPADGREMSTLFDFADKAMYETKRARKAAATAA
jgi:diguanylate cyclase (GGDEF)-like protein